MTRSPSRSPSRPRPTLVKLANTKIVPQHIWSKVADPVKFTNEQAIGTGPYTVKSFNGQQLAARPQPQLLAGRQDQGATS